MWPSSLPLPAACSVHTDGMEEGCALGRAGSRCGRSLDAIKPALKSAECEGGDFDFV